ncbi:hypothetical protein CKO42_23195 [Lamprobacter modestohalophilus]|uniref:Uncharacterized protein n=1 Tax=Lamprobacter modestohalophilus TaxID=1064514 RepID=A0A9X1B6L3_9GAMM|nr:hypothetical protein [Lamprobacter modestohalophilus]MBK1621269.1 hypothetical protein [Lamprobacter modestohalophilus]
MSVDVVQLYYPTGDDSGSHKQPWTRVRVEAPVDADLTVHARDQRHDKTPTWLPRTTGDAAFEAKYILYAPPALDLQEALPAPARAAFVRADPSATLSGGYVWWMRVKHVRDPELMVAVVEACLAVARATRR